jgi:RNA polymerase sigma-70 factor (ECF subfamily)
MEPARSLRTREETPSDERELVEAVLRRDRKATAEFVDRYADCVYSYIRRRLAPRPEAVDDLVQDVFIAAWQGLGHFRADATLEQWLLGIARHKVEDHYRRRLREAELPDGDQESVVEPAVVPQLEEELDRTFQGEKVQRVLALIPETYSLALLWRYQEERSVREMAQMTGKTEKAIERLLARARESFRKRWNHGQ